MKKQILFFILAFILITGCTVPTNSGGNSTTIAGGTITINLTNGTSYNGNTVYLGVFPNSLTQANLTQANVLGSNKAVLSSGTCNVVIGTLGNDALPLTLAGGGVYQIAGFIDVNSDASTSEYYPDSGDQTFIKTSITINGNQTVTVNCTTDVTTVTGTVATPTFSLGSGTYPATQNVTISTTTGEATIRYTTDGSTPSETKGTVYSSTVHISATTTLKAIAYKANWSDSNVASATYTISTYTVTYNGNGNTGGSAPTDNTAYSFDATVTVLGNTGNLINVPTAGTAEAFKFGGWNTASDGSGTTYATGTGTFTITGSITLYAKWIPFSIGDIGPAGGLICYDMGSWSFFPGWRYLEAAPNDQSTGIQWYNGSYGTIGGTGTTVGTGNTNTIAINYVQGAGSYAAKACTSYNGGSHNDWFLPSLQELNSMYNNLYLSGVGGFTANYYWSSSEFNDTYAWAQNFTDGTATNYIKSSALKIRAVRRF